MTTVGLAATLAYAAYEDTPGGISGAYGGHATVQVVEEPTPAIVIAFRGSESITDWIVNGLRWKTRFTPFENRRARVHAGFMAQYTGLRVAIFGHVMSSHRENTELELIVTGHSLGGALATMFAAELATVLPQSTIQCYAFNSPMVGNAAFVTEVSHLPNVHIRRWNTAYDVVPCLPCWGYVHTPGVRYVAAPPGSTVRSRHSMAVLVSRLSQTA